MNGYPVQAPVALVGSKNAAQALAPSTLTAAYADNRKAINVGGMDQSVLLLSYTTGEGETNNVLDILVEFSNDAVKSPGNVVNWFREASEASSSGTVTEYQAVRAFTGAAAATTYTLRIPIPVAEKFVRISFKETGRETNFGTIFAELVKSGI